MPDPIREGLVKAGDAARVAMSRPGCCMEGTGCELPPCHCSRVAAAAAIVAFLRALPTHHMRRRYPGGLYDTHGMTTKRLASLVEAAAKERGNL
jgi:hypothetical protein